MFAIKQLTLYHICVWVAVRSAHSHSGKTKHDAVELDFPVTADVKAPLALFASQCCYEALFQD